MISAFNTVHGLRTIRAVFSDFKKVRIESVDDFYILKGTVSLNRFKTFQEALGKFPGVISMVEPDRGIMKDMIKFKVQILEVNKGYAKNLGIAWSRSTSGPSIGFVKNFRTNGSYVLENSSSPFDSGLFRATNPVVDFNDRSSYSFLGLAFGLTSQINLLKEEGAARTLAEPYLSTRSGESARFHSGGSYPLAVLNEFGQPVVQMQDYGIELDISPYSDENGNIVSTIRAKMSSLDFSIVVNGVPGLLTRETNSVINLRSGDTMVISGLTQVEDSKAVEKMPFLGDIPILGALFTSKHFIENKTELIILVTPTIVPAENEIPKDLEKHIDSLQKVLQSTDIENELLD